MESSPAPLLKMDVLGRVKTPPARREQLLDEFARRGTARHKFAGLVGVKHPTFATWVQQRKRRRDARRQLHLHRRGQQEKITRGSDSWKLFYNTAGQLLSEAGTAGTLNGLRVTNAFDAYLRRTNVASASGATVLTTNGYTYDNRRTAEHRPRRHVLSDLQLSCQQPAGQPD